MSRRLQLAFPDHVTFRRETTLTSCIPFTQFFHPLHSIIKTSRILSSKMAEIRSTMSTLSGLECFPKKILEHIFLQSLNVNLLLASSRFHAVCSSTHQKMTVVMEVLADQNFSTLYCKASFMINYRESSGLALQKTRKEQLEN